MEQKELYQLELLKTNPEIIKTIENPTDEMKWIVINTKSIHIQELEVLNEEMMNKIVSLSLDFISRINIDWSKIKEESIIKGIKNTKNTFMSIFLVELIKNCNITSKIALELCLKNVLFYTEEKVKKELNENDKEIIIEKYLNDYINKYNSKKSIHEILPKDLLLNENQWKKLIDNNIFTEMFFKREDSNTIYRQKFIDSNNGNFINFLTSSKNNIRTEDFLYWFEKYSKIQTEKIKENLNYLSSKQKIEVLKKYGYLIEYVDKPKVSECMTAISCDPFNIQYIKKPSEKMIETAINLNKDVSKILGEKYIEKNKYPEKYYLVKFEENLADEDNLVKIMIVKGKEMEDFMNQSFTLCFGNLDDDEPRKVSKCAKIKPITQEEIKILKKFDLNDLESGYFNFDYEEEDEENDEDDY